MLNGWLSQWDLQQLIDRMLHHVSARHDSPGSNGNLPSSLAPIDCHLLWKSMSMLAPFKYTPFLF